MLASTTKLLSFLFLNFSANSLRELASISFNIALISLTPFTSIAED